MCIRDSLLFIDLFEVVSNKKWKLGSPEELLASVFDNPKARFEITFPMYSVSRRGSHLVPTILIRSTQGHSSGGESVVVVSAAQVERTLEGTLPAYCVHGTNYNAWRQIKSTTRSLLPGGPESRRAAVHFAISLPGDTGRITSGFRTGSTIYAFFDVRAWLTARRRAF